MRRLFLAATMAGALIGLLASSTEASFPGRSGKIALASGLPGSHKYRIQTMTPGGKGLRTILTAPLSSVFAQGEPVYSPDGATIAFELDDDIYVVGADGTDLRPVTSGSEKDTNPSFSPSGATIAFSRIVPGGSEIFSIGIDGSGLTQLTTEKGNDRDPVWSPRGNAIAFVSERSGTPHIWLMRPDGSYQRLLTPDRKSRRDGQSQPEFAPSGGRLVFSRGADLVSTRVDGTDPEVLNRAGILIQPTYSPDGRWIAALEAFRNRKDFDIVVMSADGSGKRTIRRHVANAYGIGWQPIHG